MALAVTSQVLEDGPRNLVLKVIAADTIGPTEVSSMAPCWTSQPMATSFAVRRIDYNVGDATSVQLAWDADTDVPMANFNGYGCMDFTDYGGLQNNAGTGKTGVINVAVTGTGGFTIILWLIKQGPVG
jgi:hypothetical protein